MTAHAPTSSEIGWTSLEQPRGTRQLRMVVLLPVFAIVLVISVRTVTDSVLDAPVLGGLALVLAATLLTFTHAYAQFSPSVMAAIPALDLAAICALSLEPGAQAVGMLVAVPAMWLGGIFAWRGVAGVGVLSTLGFVVLGPLYDGQPPGGGTQAASMVALAVVSSGLMVFVVRLTISHLVELQDQGDELAGALEVAEQRRQHLNAIVDTVDIGLAAIEPDGTYTSMNPRHRQFLAIVFPDGHGGMAGQTGYVYAADNLTPLTVAQLPSVRATNGESFTDATMWIGKDPLTRLAISASARPMSNRQGEFVGAVLSYHDITDLMTALRVKDDFITLVSHELRTPLTSIMGYLELAAEYGHQLPDDVVHYLGVASRNAERLLRLVSDLLTAGHSDGSGMEMTLDRVDMSRLVQLAVDDLTQRIDVADLELEVDIEPRLFVTADPGRVAQVVDNLLSNAVKYTLPGGTITVSLARRNADVQLCVRDTGIGVSELDQKELFTKFFQATNATKRAIPGIGLGLVIAKAIVEAHGGTITVESAEDLGTTVRVNLPAGPTEADPLPRPLIAVGD